MNDFIKSLQARLPELEWKLHGVISIKPEQLPRGLFRQTTPQACVREIREDLTHLITMQKDGKSAQYLAKRIEQKINVLVQICKNNREKKETDAQPPFGFKSFVTRQQWLQALEQEIATLSAQQQALLASLKQLQKKNDAQAVLGLRSELGQLERQLTLAKEKFAQVLA
ncbi:MULTISPECIES: hypothetical protein [Legionella]|uniref:Coiled-coil protein n=1 Tax=Legionella septentrionalis TaxID=2498109 RepID=A0A433JLG5_9GAMM|nr:MULTISPECIES: hypothetical protein [Legionella]MCP0913914.1 hypothetical protein [Legionella sp. 27cVA30]RUQ90421.1 hypothetical protein EKM59_02105 [Legionella septentrionalis]RUR00072.1 hypothetical protein ELY11_03470 [Legionella septentrionalis]RUR10768.1 hypothetical protein ELY14_04305 [Legionella septentrionalis]RUR16479.1 hypothetical protein ELY10_03020 [Legionella septentrionalis]